MKNNKLKIVFFASGKIAVPTLEFLIREKYDIACVVTAPDARKGRHLLPSYTPIKEFALKHKLNIFQPHKLSAKDTVDYLKDLHPDIFVVFSFSKILPKQILDIPRKYPLNIHASLLPKYRGAAPINWALMNGDKETGVTIIRMDEGMDTGDIVLKSEVNIDEGDNCVSLEEKLAKLAPLALKEVLSNIVKENISFSKQDEKNAALAPKLKKEYGRINWSKTAEDIRNQVRGLFSWPGAFTYYKGKILKIWNVDIVDLATEERCAPGEIAGFDKNGIIVAASPGFLLMKELQIESSKKTSAWSFVQGRKIKKGDKFE